MPCALDRLVNTAGRALTFRPIQPELSVDLYIVTKKYQAFSPAAKVFYARLQERPRRDGSTACPPGERTAPRIGAPAIRRIRRVAGAFFCPAPCGKSVAKPWEILGFSPCRPSLEPRRRF